MKLKNKILLITLLLMTIILAISPLGSVQAATGKLKLNIKFLRTSGYGYKVSHDSSAHTVWKIYNAENDNYATIYCLKGGPGFGSADMSESPITAQDYTQYFDLKQPSTITGVYKSTWTNLEDTKYKALLWALDNFYVLPTKDPSQEEQTKAADNKKLLLDAAWKYTEKAVEDGDFEAEDLYEEDFQKLTDDDIDVVQQLVVWYFTNQDNDGYKINKDGNFTLSLNATKNTGTSADQALSDSSENGEERMNACKGLFKYFINTAEEQAASYDYTSTTSKSAPVDLKDTAVTLEVKNDRKILGPYKIEQLKQGIDYTLQIEVQSGTQTLSSGDVKYLTSKESNTEEKDVKKLVGKDFYISVPASTDTESIKLKISGSFYNTTLTYWTTEHPKASTDQPVVVVEKVKNTFTDENTFNQGEFDLALRKFIIKIGNQEIKEGANYKREPKISADEITNLSEGRGTWDSGTTAKKDHPKDALKVETGDIVRYKIRVYNEGEIAGYATEVTDHLPDGLEFIEPGTEEGQSQVNKTYKWTCDDGKTVKTNYLQDKKIDAFKSGNESLDYQDLEIECKVVAKPGAEKLELKNIAEITAHKDEYGITDNNRDRDSQPKNVTVEGYGETNKQDDDDFERLYLEPAKGTYEIELEKVDSRNTSKKLQGATFEVKVDDQPLKDGTYTTDTSGKISITDIPITTAGTQIVTLKETNAPTGYSNQKATITLTVTTKIQDGVCVVEKIDSSGTIEQGPSENTTLNGFTAKLEGSKIKIQMKNYQLDLALRKFIINIDGKDQKTGENYTREPKISEEEKTKLKNGEAKLDSGTTAFKDHPKNELQVHTGSKVVYKIRVYNEGEIAGYAKKVTDHLPEGLKLATGSQINIDNGWKSTSDDGRTVETEHLASKLLDAFDGENLDYEDLKIECEVVAKPGATSKELKNIAEITAHSDEYGDTTVKDRDSQPNNVPTNDYGEESKQDDDDFERLVLPQAEGKYELELEKVDSQNVSKKLQGAKFEIKVDGQPLNATGEYTTDAQGKISIKNIPVSEAGTQTVTIKEKSAPTGYSNQGIDITLKVKLELEDGQYVVKSITTADQEGSSDIKGVTSSLNGNKISVQIKNYQLDLALRKFIISIAGNDVKTDDKYTREPSISSDEIEKLENGTVTTAKKVHQKDPLEVKTGDRVIYVIRVYNEGEIAGYAKKVTDHLPDGLILASNSNINTEYGWSNPSGDGKTIETEHLATTLLNAFDGEHLHYEDLKIECEVTAKPGEENTTLKNIAEITEHSDEYNDTTVKDRDSQPGNVDKETYGEESQQDDDDFERLFMRKTGKYSLELEKADGQNLNEKLQNAEFEITLPDGTKNTYTTNKQGKITINELPITEVGEQTITIKETKSPLGYSKSVDPITVKVITELQDDEYITKTIVIDEKTIDSTLTEVTSGKTELKANVVNGKIYIQMENYKLDLALRKFIISIAGKELLANNEESPEGTTTPKYSREPVITDEELEKLENGTASLDDGTTAQKVHSKEPLVVQTGDKVIYVIRVYNEGKIAGYAKKVTDYLPEGLKFLPESELNKQYGWTNPNGDGRTIETEHLSDELLDAFDGKNLDYKDLKIECEVVAEAGEQDKLLKNIAEITKHSDENGDETVEDRDSTPDNVKKDEYEDKSQEDDDDFEDLIIEKAKEGSYNLTLEKLNGQNEKQKLDGAEFEVTLPDGSKQTLTTNAQGNISISNLPITKLETQVIKIMETKAPEGYSRSTDTIEVKVTAGIEKGKYVAKTIEIANQTLNSSSKELTVGKTNLTANVKDGTIFIQIDNYMLDLALRKFITKVNDTDITNRVPVFTKLSETEFKYEHPKTPVEVAYGNIVTYTLRIFNEGKIAGYANKIKDDLPEGLEFLPDNEVNKTYRWKMYKEDGTETTDVAEAEYIETDYLAKENEKEENANLLKAFDQETMTMPDYRDVKIAFKVTEPNTSDRIITNIAEITDDRDENNEPVDDVDSTPDNDEPDEDDIDEEHVKVKYFDLSLKKWVSEAIVTNNGKTTVTKTGHTGDENPEPPVKVEIRATQMNKTIVKFKFVIKVTNEGEIAGYAKELIDYIPEGLKFDAKDNPQWREEDGKVLTDQLKDTLLQPGESAQVEIILTWINGSDNLGEKVNWAEIYKDENEYNSPDIDSVPGNNEKGEDDIDNAPVLLSTRTGKGPTYILLVLTSVGMISGSVILIKKFVL